MFNPLFSWQRNKVRKGRARFFNMILDSVSHPPRLIDDIMAQTAFFFPCSSEGMINDPEQGNLVFHIKPTFHENSYDYAYSIYQIGDLLKIGLLLGNGLDQAPLLDWNREISDLWWGLQPEKLDRSDITLYEWTFLVPELYNSWVLQERFILGIRHIHFRVLRIIHDYAKVTANRLEMAKKDYK